MDQVPGQKPVGVFVGLTVLDLINRVEHYPGPNEKVTATSQELSAGGPAANAAVTFARLGGHAILITAVGQSVQARVAYDDLLACGVEVIDCAEPEFHISTSCITVVAESGDRSIVSLDAVHAPTSMPASLKPRIRTAVRNSSVLLLDGHHPDLAKAVLDDLKDCQAADAPVTVLDAGRFKPQFAWLLPNVDHVVASQDFADPQEYVPHSATMSNVSRRAGQILVRTFGGQPARFWVGDHSGEVSAQPTRVRDTSGAGDAFHGGYAFAIAVQQGHESEMDSVKSAIGFAHEVARHRVAHVGPRSWLGTLPQAVLPMK